MPILRTTCGCCNTKVGSIVIGWYSLVLALLGALLIILGLIFWDFLKTAMTQAFHNIDRDYDPPAYFFTWIFIGNIVALIVIAVYVAVCAFMIRGAQKDKPRLLLPWLSWTIMIVIFGIISSIAQLAMSAAKAEPYYLGALVVSLLLYGVWIYFILVVFSQFQVLRGT